MAEHYECNRRSTATVTVGGVDKGIEVLVPDTRLQDRALPGAWGFFGKPARGAC